MSSSYGINCNIVGNINISNSLNIGNLSIENNEINQLGTNLTITHNLNIGGALKVGIYGEDAGSFSYGLKNLFITNTYSSAGIAGWWLGGQNQNPSTNDNDFNFMVVFSDSSLKYCGWIQDNRGSTQMNFTGQHRCKYDEYNIDKIGLIVSFTGLYYGLDKSPRPTINDSLPIIELISNDNDESIFGVISSKEDNNQREFSSGNFISAYEIEDDISRTFVNSIGEGSVWVCNKNGNFEMGDLITSSSVTGYGMKQTDDIIYNYTLGKITQDIDFDNIPNWNDKVRIIDDNGNISITGNYKAVFVGCVYYCG